MFSIKDLSVFVTNSFFLVWSGIFLFKHLPSASCYTPWLCLLGLFQGNISLLLHTLGSIVCGIWHGDSKLVKSVPGYMFWASCFVAGCCYIWAMAMVGIIHGKPPPCEEKFRPILLGHFVHGLWTVALFLGMFVYAGLLKKEKPPTTGPQSPTVQGQQNVVVEI
jgi:hypothetical protein